MPALSEYEKQKQENIKRNQELLRSLGLDSLSKTIAPKEPKTRKAPPKSKKRKVEETEDDASDKMEEDSEEPPSKAKRTDTSPTPAEGVRRSSRNAGKKIDYSKEIKLSREVPVAYSSGVKNAQNEGPLGSADGAKRVHNPKRFGHIPGVAVGTWWETRMGCSRDSVHAPPVGGISGGKDGAHSVALSGGYDDDVDLGYAFTYTGSGGRDLKGTKQNPKNLRTAPQSSDQTFDNHFNQMLLKSSETKKPVRVIRGFKLKSKYAPYEGYRYDGLYVVERAWMARGNNPKGFQVCKYAFKRLPDQPPLPVRDADEENNEDSAADEEEVEDDGNEDGDVAEGEEESG
ncbi:PUA-like domain-containing protein [Coprinopsis sp. MPI-PUGE-AT-0042]|nr:PUA-like domain-containing protein [Coprinopsis sp. MPI-PUGE-AT-0042]